MFQVEPVDLDFPRSHQGYTARPQYTYLPKVDLSKDYPWHAMYGKINGERISRYDREATLDTYRHTNSMIKAVRH